MLACYSRATEFNYFPPTHTHTQNTHEHARTHMRAQQTFSKDFCSQSTASNQQLDGSKIDSISLRTSLTQVQTGRNNSDTLQRKNISTPTLSFEPQSHTVLYVIEC
jgi:hypothetical protein